ncbi:hypothetical protein QQP08_022355 [Theobroma cacao]|nr:hypothetical protein QQP08_022355 [Theobroma cacao]
MDQGVGLCHVGRGFCLGNCICITLGGAALAKSALVSTIGVFSFIAANPIPADIGVGAAGGGPPVPVPIENACRSRTYWLCVM